MSSAGTGHYIISKTPLSDQKKYYRKGLLSSMRVQTRRRTESILPIQVGMIMVLMKVTLWMVMMLLTEWIEQPLECKYW